MLPSPTDIPKKSSEPQLNRACEGCRTSKVRCLPLPGSSSQCQRCAKAERQCVFAAPAKRRQRKRTDVRVAELEREVRQLTSLLRPNTASISPVAEADPGHSDGSMDEDEEHSEAVEGSTSALGRPDEDSTRKYWTSDVRSAPGPGVYKSSKPDLLQEVTHPTGQDLLQPTDQDILDRGVITEDLAEELLNIYRDELVHDYPASVVPADWTVQDLRSKKPALFHAVMAAASQSKGSALSNKLHEEIIYLYARSLFIRGEKGLQWIQAIFVTLVYYTPPNHPAQMQIYQYMNIAGSMALELGLASKPRTHEELPKRAIRSLQKISSAGELLENCRTILALYTLMAGLGVRLRRPNILQFNSWLEECQNILSLSPAIEDRRVIAWLKMQRTVDEAYNAFGFDDASTSFTLSELRVQAILRVFEKKMHDWKKSIPEDIWTASLTIEFHQNMMSMWEFAMDGGRYDAPEFRNRHLTLPALDDESLIQQPETLLSRTALQVSATIMCISSAHAVLDAILQIPTPKLQKSPGIVFVRSIYSLVVLLRADYAIGTDAGGMGEYLESQNLNIDYYIDALLKMIEEAIGPQKCRIPSHWLFVMQEKIVAWHREHRKWREGGRHLLRGKKKEGDGNANATATAHVASSSTTATTTDIYTPPEFSLSGPLPPTSSSSSSAPLDNSIPPIQPQQQQPPHPQQPLPDFNNLTTPFPWQFQTRLFNQNTNPQRDPSTYGASGPDMMDFSSAFSNGDLYLWSDMADNFGGWIPQGGSMYSDAQFGGMGGGQGF
ncbi:hypothetical protein CC80DRAFT_522120 [Byssothecium circinans]|uniref:Zn(2)-C6 fungal-type domain-containing protein n=1 Tax=Byssothecium circinans TaxID=147558 RepID=A0A6A5UD38_9PLEO|nr:hypothetical protein CC80DRAFT_522120 [Byssothecium circinans]